MVNNFTTIKQRIKQVAVNKGISYEDLYKIIEMTDGSFKGSAIKRPINSDAIEKLYTKFQDIDLHWLITGEHKKVETYVLNEPTEAYKKPINEIDLLGLSKRIDIVLEQNNEIIQKLDRNIALDIIKEETKKMKS